MENIDVQLIYKPRRKVIIKRGIQAAHYFEYCEEVGCEIWDTLVELAGADREPVCMWLPQSMILPGTSQYVQGVEKPADYEGSVPEGFDVIALPEGQYLQFRGKPFAEETFEEAIAQVWKAMADFDPARMGFIWDEENPRIQLEPRCERGYIELRAVRRP